MNAKTIISHKCTGPDCGVCKALTTVDVPVTYMGVITGVDVNAGLTLRVELIPPETQTYVSCAPMNVRDLPPLHAADVELLRRVEQLLSEPRAIVNTRHVGLLYDVRWRLQNANGRGVLCMYCDMTPEQHAVATMQRHAYTPRPPGQRGAVREPPRACGCGDSDCNDCAGEPGPATRPRK